MTAEIARKLCRARRQFFRRKTAWAYSHCRWKWL